MPTLFLCFEKPVKEMNRDIWHKQDPFARVNP
jgi:hypothetical protein